MSAPLITLSGLDGAGKSLQLALLLDLLTHKGFRPMSLWSRGGYTSGMEAIKGMFRKLPWRTLPPSGRNPKRDQAFTRPHIRKTWLALALVDLARVYGLQIRSWLHQGRAVICDRYLWDTLVDFQMAFPMERVDGWPLWAALAMVAPKPDVAIFLDLPPDEAWHRAKQKGDPFLIDETAMARRKGLYDAVAGRAGWTILDARQSPEAVSNEIRELLDRLLA